MYFIGIARTIETGQILNKYGMMRNNPWHFMSSLSFHYNFLFRLYCVYTMFPAVTAATFQTTVSKTG